MRRLAPPAVLLLVGLAAYLPVLGAGFVYDEDTEWSWSLFGLRLLGTPFTFALDVLTSPVQAFFLDDDDDC